MPEDSLKVVVSKLESMENTLQDHGLALKDLSRAFTAQAVQNEQIKTIVVRLDAMWISVDRIKTHQQRCPREQVPLMWWALGGLFVSFVTYIIMTHK
jgi:hypothetical protein